MSARMTDLYRKKPVVIEARQLRVAALASMLAVILAANALTVAFGLVTVAGLTATAGTWVTGLVFVARDWLHDTGGRKWVVAAIVLGAIVSAILSPAIAIASAVAFTVSEMADWAVYSPLRHRSRIGAALASNTVGAILDSLLFLAIAGFSLALLPTQVVVKVAASTVVVIGVRLALLRQPVYAESGGRYA